MKFKEFTYTKTNGDVSKRSLIVTSEPAAMVSGYDTSDMTDDEFAEFVTAYKALREKQQRELMELIADHDLTHSYRNFLPNRMSEVTTEHV